MAAEHRTARDKLHARVVAEIDRQADRIVGFSEEVLRHPETGFREHATAARVVEQLDAMGLSPRTGLAGTGVKARLAGRADRRTVAILGELDSLLISDHEHADPATGGAHACGHHAQLASMIGAGLGLQAVADELDGDVVLFAVPAEECIELDWRLAGRAAGEREFVLGKPELIRLGEFDDVDLAMLTHTGAAEPLLTSTGTANGSLIKQVRFTGRASHVGVAPWDGINAYQALSVAIHAIDAQRETFRDSDHVRVSHLVTTTGEAVSAIPAVAEMEMMIRAATVEAMQDASRKVDRALRAGAMAIGAGVEITTVTAYLPMACDDPLVDVIDGNARALLGDDRVQRDGGHMGGSTDVGDLGRIMPVAHPTAASGHDGPLHARDYVVRDHHAAAVNPAKVMASAVVDLLYDGAAGAERVIADSGPKLSREEYVALRRGMDAHEVYDGGAG